MTYPIHRLQARPRSPCLTQNSVGLRWPCFPTTMLSFSWINLPNISISGLIKKARSENIVQILVATFTLLALLPHSFYFHSIIRDRSNLRLADPKLVTFRSPLYQSFGCSQFKHFFVPDYRDNLCDESRLHAIRTICVYCHLLELCKTCCLLSDIHFAVVCEG